MYPSFQNKRNVIKIIIMYVLERKITDLCFCIPILETLLYTNFLDSFFYSFFKENEINVNIPTPPPPQYISIHIAGFGADLWTLTSTGLFLLR